MAATNFTPIQLYRTATAAAAPVAGNLADGELALNTTDEKLYFKNAGGSVKLLAYSGAATPFDPTAPGPIGGTTPSTGAFTTLSASSTVSGAGFTSRFAAPGPIGSTTPSTGAFTTLSATGNVTASAGAFLPGDIGSAGQSYVGKNSSNTWLNAPTSQLVYLSVGNSAVATVQSTGIAVTGTLSATVPAGATGNSVAVTGTNISSENTTTYSYGVYGNGRHASNARGVFGESSTINSNSTSYGVHGKISSKVVEGSYLNANQTAAVYGEATGFGTGTTTAHVSAGYFDNKITSGATSYGVVGATVAGATNIYPLAGVHAAANVFLVSRVGGVGIGGALPPNAGVGITFPVTQSSSTDVNTLDDYVEGTWTPNLGGTETFTARSGKYTKIGNVVTLRASIIVNTIGTGQTYIIYGIPFAASTSASGGFSVEYTVGLATAVVSLQGYVSSSQITINSRTAAAASAGANNLFTNGTAMDLTATYFIA